VKRHFHTVSRRFGFTIVPPESAVNAAGYAALAGGDAAGAIELFQYNTELFPHSANAHDSLGEALERAGRLEEAQDSYIRAVARAVANADGNLALFTANRDRVAAALARGKTDE
jgi:Flp pilus assembly protein TadD